MTALRLFSILLSPLLLLFQISHAMPIWLLKTAEIKCIDLEAAQDTVLMVDYEAMDLPADETATITIQVVTAHNRMLDRAHHESPVMERLRTTKEQLSAGRGSLTHTMEVDGIARLCLQAPRGSKKNKTGSYYRFGILVLQQDEEVPNAAQTPQDTATNVETHLTHMEIEMKRIDTTMKVVLHEADFAKDRDAQMHKQFEQMHSTTFYWPIVQLVVLLVTGFTQASHIVHFFKSRRII